MLNWLTKGYIDITKYVNPPLFLLWLFIWYRLVKKNLDLKKNRKILVKTAIYALVAAASAPLFIIVLSGNLFNFLSGLGTVFKSITSFSAFIKLTDVIFKGFSITGGLLFLSVLLVLVVKEARKMTFAILYPFPLFAALARINCFLKGCCFGSPATESSLFSITYPAGSPASRAHFIKFQRASRFLESMPVHPTQLYIIASMLLLYGAVVLMNHLGVRKNIIAGTVLSGYSFANFLIEFLREEPLLFNFLTLGQFMDIGILSIGIYLIFFVKEEAIIEGK